MSLIDWAIVIVSVVALRLVSLSARSYMKSVADFLSANRLAGRYLLTIASEMGSTGTISIIGAFELYLSAGLPPVWWALMNVPVGAIIALTGWIFYRFRETRALTLAQFFEMRYSRNFRIFAGTVCWITGVVNFGLFPVVAARFFIYFCGLPLYYHIPGLHFAISSLATVIAVDLILALTFVNMGGQISVMITECVQGIFSSIAFLIVCATVLMQVNWSHIATVLQMSPANASMIHPFHTHDVQVFNVWYYLIGVFGTFYGFMSWQGTSAFNSAARTPHEQKMGNIIRGWRDMPRTILCIVLPIAALAVLKLPEFSAKAAAINATVKSIGNPVLQTQMQVPIALAQMLPIGVKGLLATAMLFLSFTCHDTYMHSWGSIFIQDVYIPITRKVLTAHEHIRLLRLSIIFVAVFSFFFGLYYPQEMKIFLFFAVTGTIWVGGSGAVIIGGLYWKRGTTAAAYTALITGAVLGVIGLFGPQLCMHFFHRELPPQLNGQVLWFIGMMSASVLYIVISLLTSRGRVADMEKLLNRGAYTVERNVQQSSGKQSKLLQFIGITNDFSLADKVLAVGLVIWNGAWFALFLVITAINLVHPLSYMWWKSFWHTYIWLYFAMSVPATIWFAIGGALDIRALCKSLSVVDRDMTDDGRVSDVFVVED